MTFNNGFYDETPKPRHDADPETQMFPPVEPQDYGDRDFAPAESRPISPEPRHYGEDYSYDQHAPHNPVDIGGTAPAATGLARWFDLKPLTTEVILTAVIAGVVALFGTAVADTVLARLFGNYEALGWGFSIISAFIVFAGTLLAAGIFLLLFAGTKAPQKLYSLLFWVVIPSLIILITVTAFSMLAVPYVLVVLIWSIPVTLIPSRSDQHRID